MSRRSTTTARPTDRPKGFGNHFLGCECATCQGRQRKADLASVPSLRARIAELESQLSTAQNDHRLATSEVGALRARITASDERVSELAKEKSGMEARALALQTRVEGLTSDLTTSEAERAQWCENYNEAHNELHAMTAEASALRQDLDRWIADFNKCADSLRDAELTISRQAGIITNRPIITETQAGSPLPAIIICSVAGAGVGFLGCRFFPGMTQAALMWSGGAVAALAVVAVLVGTFLRSIDHAEGGPS